LKGGESGLERNDDNEQDGETEVVGGWVRVPEGTPADEKDNYTNPKNGTKAAKDILQYLD
jgi:hypothetical protein